MKRIALLAAASSLAILGSANAADLGGDCCADLEERVAELEATTARKGNRKVSLQVSGRVNQAVLFFDAPGESNSYIGTNNQSSSRFTFRGDAQVNADWSAGYLMELQVSHGGLGSASQDVSNPDASVSVRHEALYVKSKAYGTFWLGHTSSAMDGITEISLGGGMGTGPDFSNETSAFDFAIGDTTTFSTIGASSGEFTGDGDRRSVARYISPTIAGFSLSASYGQDDYAEATLRYAGEFGAVRFAGGVGYSEDTTGGTTEEEIGASASISHTPTGIYLSGSYGELELDDETSGTDTSWYVQGGIDTKFVSYGTTNLWAMYGVSEREIGFDGELEYYGVGISQNIDAAALELYAYYKHFDADSAAGEAEAQAIDDSLDVVMVGAMIKF